LAGGFLAAAVLKGDTVDLLFRAAEALLAVSAALVVLWFVARLALQRSRVLAGSAATQVLENLQKVLASSGAERASSLAKALESSRKFASLGLGWLGIYASLRGVVLLTGATVAIATLHLAFLQIGLLHRQNELQTELLIETSNQSARDLLMRELPRLIESAVEVKSWTEEEARDDKRRDPIESSRELNRKIRAARPSHPEARFLSYLKDYANPAREQLVMDVGMSSRRSEVIKFMANVSALSVSLESAASLRGTSRPLVSKERGLLAERLAWTGVPFLLHPIGAIDFRRSDLRGRKLDQRVLTGAMFAESDLSSTSLREVRLELADLSETLLPPTPNLAGSVLGCWSPEAGGTSADLSRAVVPHLSWVSGLIDARGEVADQARSADRWDGIPLVSLKVEVDPGLWAEKRLGGRTARLIRNEGVFYFRSAVDRYVSLVANNALGGATKATSLALSDVLVNASNLPTYIVDGQEVSFERAVLLWILVGTGTPVPEGAPIFDNAAFIYCRDGASRLTEDQFMDFSGANLKGIRLRRARLRYAAFRGAVLDGADFREAQLPEPVAFLGATLGGVDIEGARVLSKDWLVATAKGAIGFEASSWTIQEVREHVTGRYSFPAYEILRSGSQN